MAEEKKQTTFEFLNNLNVSDKIDQKMGLNYLSWANAWQILMTNYPDAKYTIYTRNVPYETTVTEESVDATTGIKTTVTTTTKGENELPYFTDGRTTYVKVGVTINDNEYVEIYPVMGLKNNSISVNSITMVDVNKALQRAFVKACARHGLGLYVYAGEDLPDADKPKPVDYSTIIDEINNTNFAETESTETIKLVGVIGDALKRYGAIKGDPRFDVINNYMADLVKEYKINKISENSIAVQKVAALINKLK